MEVMNLERPHRVAESAQLPTSPCYLVQFETGKGLQWLASARHDWQLTDGRPAIIALADAAGISGTHLFRLKAAPATPPGNHTIARLVKLGAKVHRVAREVAEDRLFWFFDPERPADVERLRGYIAAVSTEALAA